VISNCTYNDNVKYQPNTIGSGELTAATGGAAFPYTVIADVVISAIPFVISAINRGKPNPNDWQGWDALDSKKGYPIGTNAISWIINDGQSISNEALNILQYIQNYGYDNVLTYNSYYQRTITAQDLANKLKRGGFVNEANKLLTPPTASDSINNVFTNLTSGQGSNIKYVLYGGIGLLLVYLLSKK